jgi:hypothetical protein
MPVRAAHDRDRIDRAIHHASWLGAFAMFAYGAALSFDVLHSIAQAAGLSPVLAWLWPLGFETFMAVAALALLAEQRSRPHRTPWYPWVLTALAAGSSIALNFGHPYIPWTHRHGCWSPASTASHPSVRRLRGTCSCSGSPTARTPARTRTPARNGQDGEPSRALVRVLLAGESRDRPVSWQDVAGHTGLSRSRAYALLREERARLAAGNGHQPTLDPTDTAP